MHIFHFELKPNNAKKLIHVGLRVELRVLSFIHKGWGSKKGQSSDEIFGEEKQK